jgi:hypothetical protein
MPELVHSLVVKQVYNKYISYAFCKTLYEIISKIFQCALMTNIMMLTIRI